MNRYKFRAWHKSQKRMFEVYGLGQDFITENTMDGAIPGQNCFNGDELEDIIVMLESPISDCNGNKMYEGDIIQAPDGKIYTVKFIDGCFWAIGHKNEHWCRYLYDCTEYEIIGNLYQQGDIKL